MAAWNRDYLATLIGAILDAFALQSQPTRIDSRGSLRLNDDSPGVFQTKTFSTGVREEGRPAGSPEF